MVDMDMTIVGEGSYGVVYFNKENPGKVWKRRHNNAECSALESEYNNHVHIYNIFHAIQPARSLKSLFATVPRVYDWRLINTRSNTRRENSDENVTCKYSMDRIFPIHPPSLLKDLVRPEFLHALKNNGTTPYYLFLSAEDISTYDTVIPLSYLVDVNQDRIGKYSYYYNVENTMVVEYAQRMVNTFIELVRNNIAPRDVEFVLGLNSIGSTKPRLYMIDFNQTRALDENAPMTDAITHYANLAGFPRMNRNPQYHDEEAQGQWRFLPWPTLTPKLFFHCMLTQTIDKVIAIEMVKRIDNVLNELRYQPNLQELHYQKILTWRPVLSRIFTNEKELALGPFDHVYFLGKFTIHEFMQNIHKLCTFHVPFPLNSSEYSQMLNFYCAPFENIHSSKYTFLDINAYISLDFTVQRSLMNKAALNVTSILRKPETFSSTTTFGELQEMLNTKEPVQNPEEGDVGFVLDGMLEMVME